MHRIAYPVGIDVPRQLQHLGKPAVELSLPRRLVETCGQRLDTRPYETGAPIGAREPQHVVTTTKECPRSTTHPNASPVSRPSQLSGASSTTTFGHIARDCLIRLRYQGYDNEGGVPVEVLASAVVLHQAKGLTHVSRGTQHGGGAFECCYCELQGFVLAHRLACA